MYFHYICLRKHILVYISGLFLVCDKNHGYFFLFLVLLFLTFFLLGRLFLSTNNQIRKTTSSKITKKINLSQAEEGEEEPPPG